MRHRGSFAAVIFLCVAGYFGVMTLQEELPYIQSKKSADRLAEAYEDAEDETPLGIKIDFEGLKQMNSDIVGWIHIPGTQVNYPICRHPADNDYYLHHNPEGEENILGSIYMYKELSPDFSDQHMILFGHNMRSGQMFGDLSNYAEENFCKQHPCVYIYLPSKSMECTVQSAYTCSVQDPVFTIGSDFGEGRIITLSTCTDSGDVSRRFIVNCLVTKEK